MAELIEPENDPHEKAAEIDPAPAEPIDPEDVGDEQNYRPGDADESTGFTFEQRRFLWTLAGLNVVAVLLGAAIIVGYVASARSQDMAIAKMEDDYNTALEEFHRDEPVDAAKMFQAEKNGDKDSASEFRQELIQSYQTERTALANWRRARGLDPRDVTNDQLIEFSANLDNLVNQRLAATSQPASGPASQPDKPPGPSK